MYEGMEVAESTNETLEKMPQRKCHKVVRAAKILAVEPDGSDDMFLRLTLEPATPGAEPLSVIMNLPWWGRFAPRPGGYLVRYDDGYTSFSPAKAFEEGYTRKDASQ